MRGPDPRAHVCTWSPTANSATARRRRAHCLATLTLILISAAACSDPDSGPADPGPDAGPDAGPDVQADVATDDVEDEVDACDYDIDCDGDGLLCIEGACVAAACHPESRSCLGEEVAECDADGQDFTIVETCRPGELCSNGRCVPRVCDPGTFTCDGDSRKRCNPRGTGYDAQPCFGDQVCFDGGCVDPVCTPGKTICLDDLSLGICDEMGGGYTGELCGFGRRCFSGRCVPFHALSFAEEEDASATIPVRRPDAGFLALWIVLDADPVAPVELASWTSALDAGVALSWDPETSSLEVEAAGGEGALTLPMPLQTGDVVHLVVQWGQGEVTALVDGYAVAGPSELTLPGGTPGDTLSLGGGHSDDASWPGRIGSVWIGDGPIEAGFVPRCDELQTEHLLGVWRLNEGDGTQGLADDPQLPPATLQGATWSGGILGRYARDADSDGFGFDPEAQISCGPINDDDVLRLGDCNDGNPSVFPAAPETQDMIDNDCDGAVDETE